MERHAPAPVFCGERRPDGCGEAVMWAEFRPYEAPEVVRVDGRAEHVPGLDLKDLLVVIGRIAWYALAPPFG